MRQAAEVIGQRISAAIGGSGDASLANVKRLTQGSA
jgi:hypothetical protein